MEMRESESGRYLLLLKVGKRHKHGIHIYNEKEVLEAKSRLVAAGAKERNVKINTFEEVFR